MIPEYTTSTKWTCAAAVQKKGCVRPDSSFFPLTTTIPSSPVGPCPRRCTRHLYTSFPRSPPAVRALYSASSAQMAPTLPMDATEWADFHRRRPVLKLTTRFVRLFALCAITTTLVLVACTLSEFVSFSRAPVFLDMLFFKDDILPFHNDLSYYTPAIHEENLREKLESLLTSPLPAYQDAYDENVKACPREVTLPLVNPDRIARRGWFWERVRLRELADRRVRIVKYLEHQERQVGRLRAMPGGGRGIVLTGGNEVSTSASTLCAQHCGKSNEDLTAAFYCAHAHHAPDPTHRVHL